VVAELESGNISEAEAAGAILWVAKGSESIVPSRGVSRSIINLKNGNQRHISRAPIESLAVLGGIIPTKDMGALASQAGGWC